MGSPKPAVPLAPGQWVHPVRPQSPCWQSPEEILSCLIGLSSLGRVIRKPCSSCTASQSHWAHWRIRKLIFFRTSSSLLSLTPKKSSAEQLGAGTKPLPSLRELPHGRTRLPAGSLPMAPLPHLSQGWGSPVLGHGWLLGWHLALVPSISCIPWSRGRPALALALACSYSAWPPLGTVCPPRQTLSPTRSQ